MTKERILILGAAGRDFHNFNLMYRNNNDKEVVGFTATQIPNIEGRTYPFPLSGDLYPEGLTIFSEQNLEKIIHEHNVQTCVFSYSDVSNQNLMELAARVLNAGANFELAEPEQTMLQSSKPVISITAIRTGCGKSPTTRLIAKYLVKKGLKVAVVRHPMPYGDLAKQAVQRFDTLEDLVKHECTVEEREEYEQYVKLGIPIFAGVDYEKILREAEKDADIVIWDGGNNDTPFFKPDLDIVILDPLRAGHEISYYPGSLNFIRGGVLIINKIKQATAEQLITILKNIALKNPTAEVLEADSTVEVDKPDIIKGKKVLIIEDGPTLTHGGMKIGAGYVAATKYKAAEIIEPEQFATGSIKQAYKKFPHLKQILPALGYFPDQLAELEQTVNNSDAELVIIGTPIDLSSVIKINKPYVNVKYSTKIVKGQKLESLIDAFIASVIIEPK